MTLNQLKIVRCSRFQVPVQPSVYETLRSISFSFLVCHYTGFQGRIGYHGFGDYSFFETVDTTVSETIRFLSTSQSGISFRVCENEVPRTVWGTRNTETVILTVTSRDFDGCVPKFMWHQEWFRRHRSWMTTKNNKVSLSLSNPIFWSKPVSIKVNSNLFKKKHHLSLRRRVLVWSIVTWEFSPRLGLQFRFYFVPDGHV